MATLVTVHGTFAHSGGTADALGITSEPERQWWEKESAFESCARSLVAAEDGNLEYKAFTWSALNSEMSRREAGLALLDELRTLDAKGEPYCLIGHSHGGSVIASALVDSVIRNKPLTGLKRWITIGTPFVSMKKERFLFARLSLTRKVLLVASLMLLMMFLFYGVGELFDSHPRRRGVGNIEAFLFSAGMMSIPFVVLYVILKIGDARFLSGYGKKTVQRARTAYSDKWLALWHKDDEAVNGLRYLPKVNVRFFASDFAVPTITMASIFALPLAYLLVITSPTMMVGLANFLKNNVYDVEQYKTLETPITSTRQDMRRLQRELRDLREKSENSAFDATGAEAARQQAERLRTELREKRRTVQEKFPEFAEAERAQRFKRRFLEVDGQPCEGGSLCGQGHDYALNSRLVFHVVTDELSSALVNDDLRLSPLGGILRLLLPLIVVPLFFSILALAILAAIQWIAAHLSSLLSRFFNNITLAEIKRSAFGNDTEGEIATGADYRPSWIKEQIGAALPPELGDKIAAQSNTSTVQSIAKFRNAISTLTFADQGDTKSNLIANYLSWKELIHTSYFEVPEFCKLVARAVTDVDGFAPTEAFKADPEYGRTARWLGELERNKPTFLPIAEIPADPAEAAANLTEPPKPVSFPT